MDEIVATASPENGAVRRPSSSAQMPHPFCSLEEEMTIVIKNMMFTFGDVRNPADECAKMVETILHDQMTLIYSLCRDNAEKRRGSSTIDVIDLVFIYRKDISLLHRLYRRTRVKSESKKLLMSMQQTDGDVTDGATRDDKIYSLVNKLRTSFELLDTDELTRVLDTDYVDAVTEERMARADQRSKELDEQKYFEYQHARGIAFTSCNASAKTFTQWIKQIFSKRSTHNDAIELLAFIAYDIVEKLVESAVTVRRTSIATTENELKQSTERRSYNPDFIVNQPAFSSRFRVESAPLFLAEGECLKLHEIQLGARRLQELNRNVLHEWTHRPSKAQLLL